MRSVVIAAALLALAGCGEEAPPRPSDTELGVQIWKGTEAGAEVRPFEACLRRGAETTRPTSDLGLERIDAVLAGCAAEERALTAAIERVWSSETREELDGRIRGVRTEAIRVIKDTPYVPQQADTPS